MPLIYCFASLSFRAFALNFCIPGDNFSRFRRTLPNTPQQRHAPVLSPYLRHNGGASRACRRFLWRKSRNSVAFPLLAAAHFGDNSVGFSQLRQYLSLK